MYFSYTFSTFDCQFLMGLIDAAARASRLRDDSVRFAARGAGAQ